MRSPTRRPSVRSRRPGALAALLAAGLLAAGCGGDDDPPRAGGTPEEQRTPLLQPTTAPGPNPFTASTVLTSDVAPASRQSSAGSSAGAVPGPGAAVPGPGAARQSLRTVNGATPGLYGGTHSLPSCDVEQQARFLTADQARTRAFTQAAGIGHAELGSWLRGLTPVMLRADTRVTGHGYRDGAAVPYQAILQAGTAVLVDQYGAPRVRCACGNPLRSPSDGRRPTAQRGEPWDGYRADRVVVVNPTQRELDTLVIVNVVNDTWLERKVGTRGEEDHTPEAPPAYDPGDRHVADRPVPDAVPPSDPAAAPREAGGPAPLPPAPPQPDAPMPDAPMPDAGVLDGADPGGSVLEGPVNTGAVPDGFTPGGPGVEDSYPDGVEALLVRPADAIGDV